MVEQTSILNLSSQLRGQVTMFGIDEKKRVGFLAKS